MQTLLDLETHRHTTTIPLTPLSRDDVSAYLALAFESAIVADDVAALIWERTEGHPLFLASLVEHLRSVGALRRRDDGPLTLEYTADELRREVPSNVRSMVERQLGALDPETRRVLSYGSVLGDELVSSTLAELVGLPQAKVEETLVRAFKVYQLVTRPTETAGAALSAGFTHSLFRDALSDALVPSLRVELHRHMSRILERDPEPAAASRLAHHYTEGHEHAKAASQWIAVAEQAERRLALAEAEAACARAIAVLDRLPESERPELAVRVHRRRAGVRMAAGWFDTASEDIDAMTQWAARSADARLRVDAMRQKFRQLGYTGAFDDAVAVAREALALAAERGLAVERTLVEADLGSLQGVRGELRAATSALLSAAALEQVEPATRATVLLDLAAYLCMRGRHAEALPHLDALSAIARQASDGLRLGAALLWRGHALANLGDLSRALDVLSEGIRLSEANDDRFIAPRLLACMGWLHRELGAPERALEWDRRALALADVMPDARAHALIDSALNSALLGRAAEDALAEAEELVAAPCFSDWLVRARLAGARARICAMSGDLASAQRHAALAAQLAERHDLAKSRLRAELLRAELAFASGDARAAKATCAEIDVTLEELGLPLLSWRVEALRERVLRAEGRKRAVESSRRRLEAMLTTLANATPAQHRDAFLRHAREAPLFTRVACEAG